jgi:hypothetical protein
VCNTRQHAETRPDADRAFHQPGATGSATRSSTLHGRRLPGSGKALVEDDCAKKAVTELTRDQTSTSPPTAGPIERPPTGFPRC